MFLSGGSGTGLLTMMGQFRSGVDSEYTLKVEWFPFDELNWLDGVTRVRNNEGLKLIFFKEDLLGRQVITSSFNGHYIPYFVLSYENKVLLTISDSNLPFMLLMKLMASPTSI